MNFDVTRFNNLFMGVDFSKGCDKHWYVPFYDNFFWEEVSA